MKMRQLLTATLLATSLSACYPCETMDPCVFTDIEVGQHIDEVQAIAGAPYEILEYEDGQREYVYITRSRPVPGVRRQRKFILVTEGDEVVEKYFEEDEVHNIFYMENMQNKYNF